MEHLPAKNQTCEYCGAALNPAYYFCTVCATPFQAVDRLLPEERPAWESSETVLRKRAPQAMRVFWSFAAALLLGALISFSLFGEDPRLGGYVVSSIMVFLTTCVLSVLYWESLKVQFGRVGFNHSAAWMGLALLPLALLVNYGYHHLFLQNLAEDASALDQFKEIFPIRWTAVLILCILPAITEEIAFRGLVQHWMHSALPDGKAILMASALFSAMHLSVISAPYLFALGALLGYTRWKTGSLYPAMLIHFLHNFVVLTYFPSVN